jgi:hypothetical protein
VRRLRGVLRVSRKGNRRHGTLKPLYVCDAKGCVGRDDAQVNEYVRAVVIARLPGPDLSDLPQDGAGAKEAGDEAAAVDVLFAIRTANAKSIGPPARSGLVTCAVRARAAGNSSRLLDQETVRVAIAALAVS